MPARTRRSLVPASLHTREHPPTCRRRVTLTPAIHGDQLLLEEVRNVLRRWCERGDSNPHGIATASPSSWCVCQFRHFREEGYFFGCSGAGAGTSGALVPAAGV